MWGLSRNQKSSQDLLVAKHNAKKILDITPSTKNNESTHEILRLKPHVETAEI